MAARLAYAIYWAAAILALAILLPATLATAYLLGFGACDRPDTAATAPICSPLGRLFLGSVLIAGVLLLYLPWVRCLKRLLNIGGRFIGDCQSEAVGRFRCVYRQRYGNGQHDGDSSHELHSVGVCFGSAR